MTLLSFAAALERTLPLLTNGGEGHRSSLTVEENCRGLTRHGIGSGKEGRRRWRESMWYEWIMQGGPVFGDQLYDPVGALIVFLVGAAILFKTGNRIGWVFVGAALIWAFLTFRHLLEM